MVEHSNDGVGEGTLESEKWWNITTLESEEWWNIATLESEKWWNIIMTVVAVKVVDYSIVIY